MSSGGAGGKGVWGTPGIEMFEDGQCRDSGDPNYDSESEVSVEQRQTALRNIVLGSSELFQ